MATVQTIKPTSFATDFNFSSEKPRWQLILETAFSKDIRIMLAKGQSLREHKAPFPIAVHLLEGSIDFGVNRRPQRLEKGAILTLDANVPHDLFAHENSVVRLTLSKPDTVERVDEVVKSSRS